jgi:hypothetical protein
LVDYRQRRPRTNIGEYWALSKRAHFDLSQNRGNAISPLVNCPRRTTRFFGTKFGIVRAALAMLGLQNKASAVGDDLSWGGFLGN